MGAQTLNRQIVAPSQWEAAIAQHETTKELYERFCRDVADPARADELAFEKRHGLTREAVDYFPRRKALQQAHGYQTAPSIHDAADKLCDAMAAAEGDLMATPAPDLAALRFKLEKLLAIDEGGTDAWSADYVRQTIEDMRRLLP